MKTKLLIVSIVLVVPLAFSEDFKTLGGKEYKDANVTRVEPDGIVLTTKTGVSKVYFTELPRDVQERYGYDPQKAGDYSAQQGAGFDQARKQQEEAARQKADTSQKANQQRAQQANRRAAIQTLQASYEQLQRQEDKLLLQIGEAKKPGAPSGAVTKTKPLPPYPTGQRRSFHSSRATSKTFAMRKTW